MEKYTSTLSPSLDQQAIEADQKQKDSSSLVNVLILSVSFFLMFTSFNTVSEIQKVVVDSINAQTNVQWNAFSALCITYIAFAFSNLCVPSILTLVSTKVCLFVASLTYFLYDLAFLYPLEHGLTIVSIVCGFGAGILWVSQGQFIADNSNSDHIDRNTSLFWAIYQCSLIFGNLFFFFRFDGIERVGERDRLQVFSVLAFVSLLGCVSFLFLRKSPSSPLAKEREELESDSDAYAALKQCVTLLRTEKVICICMASFYTGLEQTFYQSIYATVVGFTRAFGEDSVKYIGFYGISNGVGAICGAIAFGWLFKRYNQPNRSTVYSTGLMSHLLAFVLVFLNHPNDSSFQESSDFGVIEPRIWIAMLCGFLLCLGDACFTTQLIALIGTVYKDRPTESSSAFAFNKFFYCLGAALGYFVGSFNVSLITHLTLLVGFGVLSDF